jgi:two-component system response regulator NreC
MPCNIVLADDHTVVRQSLKLLLENGEYTVVGEASNGAEAVQVAARVSCDIAILDIGMPVMNGIDAARVIIRESAGTKVILLSMYDDDHYVIRALRAGVSGYVLKTRAASDLLQALHDVQEGSVHLSPGISRAVVQRMLKGGEPDENILSPRESQILQLIAEGCSTKEVAARLFLSPKTVESHRGNLMQKLNVHETASLVRYAIRRGIIQA